MSRGVIPSSLLVGVDRLAKARAWGRITKAGVAFDYSWATQDTASFLLIREPHHSDEDIDRAVAEIRASGESAGPVRVARLDAAVAEIRASGESAGPVRVARLDAGPAARPREAAGMF